MNWHQKPRIGLPREVRLLGFLRKKQEEILDMFSEYSGCIAKHLTGLCVHPTFQLTYLNSQGKRETTGIAACAADIALLDFKAFYLFQGHGDKAEKSISLLSSLKE